MCVFGEEGGRTYAVWFEGAVCSDPEIQGDLMPVLFGEL